MTLGNTPPSARPEAGAGTEPPPTDRAKMVLAGILLMIPIVALMWVPSYARAEPELFGFPFFFWYQFVWVFICSALTYAAYRLTLAARPSSARRSSPRAPSSRPGDER